MAELLVVKNSMTVQSNIQKFESLSVKEDLEQMRKAKEGHLTIINLEANNNEESTPFLTATSTRSTPRVEPTIERKRATAETIPHSRRDSAIFVQKEYLNKKSDATLVEDAREILRHQPSLEDVDAVLAYLKCGVDGRHDFNVKYTSPQAAMLVRVLATHTIPDIWPSVNEESSTMATRIKEALLEIMFSVIGLEATLGHIQVLTKISQKSNSVNTTLLDFLTKLLKGSKVVLRLLHETTSIYEKDLQRQLFWQNIVVLLSGSRILAITTATKIDSEKHTILLTGSQYTKWLASNIVTACIELPPTDLRQWANLTELFRRGLSLGYRNILVSHIYTSLLLGNRALWAPLHSLMRDLPSHDQKFVLDCILDDLCQIHFRTADKDKDSPKLSKIIAGAAALINGVVSQNKFLVDCLVDWVSTTSNNQTTRGPGIRRALIALLSGSNVNLERILERSLTNFTDKSLIQNVPLSQQEHLAQIILLVIGYLHRQQPSSLKQMPIPSLIMNATSNRLASSIPQVRLLGMIVAVGMSQCVDKPGKTMDFGVEEMETDDTKALLNLIRIHDTIGEISVLRTIDQSTEISPKPSNKRKLIVPTANHNTNLVQPSKIIAIEEVSSSSDEDDLIPYQKPTDDPEDSDEDPTLINRDKPHAPIYIIDLIKQLQSPPDKLEIISLALRTAPNLISRKSGFGTEISDNIHALIAALINLQDGMSRSEHQQQRLDALVACMIAQPKEAAKILANAYFNGDFSLSQRMTILTAIGLGAREIAGFEDGKTIPSDVPNFPSQQLPPHIQPYPVQSIPSPKTLKPIPNIIVALTDIATSDTIQPIANSAIQSQTGPSILKVTRISSRLSMQQQTTPSTVRHKRIPRDLSTTLSGIYLPLISPLSAILAYASTHPNSSTSSSLMLHPSILSLHVQSLTLIIHTLGPTGLSPPSIYYSITHETLLMLTHLSRTRTVALDGLVLPAFLALLLALIDITVEIGVAAMERLVGREFGPQVAALVRWTALLTERHDVPPPMTSAGGVGFAARSEDGDGDRHRSKGGSGGLPWTVLAAGIQVKWVEIGRRFQHRMFGLAPDERFGF